MEKKNYPFLFSTGWICADENLRWAPAIKGLQVKDAMTVDVLGKILEKFSLV